MQPCDPCGCNRLSFRKRQLWEQVSATCTTVEAAENVRFRWFKNGRLLTASERDSRIRLRTFPDVSTLVIGPLEENDSGNYTCTGTAGLKSGLLHADSARFG
ncbi:hypothetical protein MRX96_048106 [Rhipicephalus microplus]